MSQQVDRAQFVIKTQSFNSMFSYEDNSLNLLKQMQLVSWISLIIIALSILSYKILPILPLLDDYSEVIQKYSIIIGGLLSGIGAGFILFFLISINLNNQNTNQEILKYQEDVKKQINDTKYNSNYPLQVLTDLNNRANNLESNTSFVQSNGNDIKTALDNFFTQLQNIEENTKNLVNLLFTFDTTIQTSSILVNQIGKAEVDILSSNCSKMIVILNKILENKKLHFANNSANDYLTDISKKKDDFFAYKNAFALFNVTITNSGDIVRETQYIVDGMKSIGFNSANNNNISDTCDLLEQIVAQYVNSPETELLIAIMQDLMPVIGAQISMSGLLSILNNFNNNFIGPSKNLLNAQFVDGKMLFNTMISTIDNYSKYEFINSLGTYIQYKIYYFQLFSNQWSTLQNTIHQCFSITADMSVSDIKLFISTIFSNLSTVYPTVTGNDLYSTILNKYYQMNYDKNLNTDLLNNWQTTELSFIITDLNNISTIINNSKLVISNPSSSFSNAATMLSTTYTTLKSLNPYDPNYLSFTLFNAPSWLIKLNTHITNLITKIQIIDTSITDSVKLKTRFNALIDALKTLPIADNIWIQTTDMSQINDYFSEIKTGITNMFFDIINTTYKELNNFQTLLTSNMTNCTYINNTMSQTDFTTLVSILDFNSNTDRTNLKNQITLSSDLLLFDRNLPNGTYRLIIATNNQSLYQILYATLNNVQNTFNSIKTKLQNLHMFLLDDLNNITNTIENKLDACVSALIASYYYQIIQQFIMNMKLQDNTNISVFQTSTPTIKKIKQYLIESFSHLYI